MSQPHMESLAQGLIAQGCRYRRTRGGYMLYCPDGKTTIAFHVSKHSDVRVMRNLKAEVRRAGLQWPKGIPG
jgi:hypothetical protein